MLIKVIILFLIVMAILGLFGRWRFPGFTRMSDTKCSACGRPRIGKGPCACGRDRA